LFAGPFVGYESTNVFTAVDDSDMLVSVFGWYSTATLHIISSCFTLLLKKPVVSIVNV
jgi:hypothetical protein